MAYKVRLTALAEADAYAAFERIRAASPAHAERWLTGLFQAVLSLGEMPARCPLIPEAEEIGPGYSATALRQAFWDSQDHL